MINRLFTKARRAARRLGAVRTVRLGSITYRMRATVLDLPDQAEEFEPWMDAVYAAALDLGPGAFVDVGVNRGPIQRLKN